MNRSKPVSIRKQMRTICVAMIATIALLCGGMTVIKTQMTERLRVSTDEVAALNHYIGQLGALRSEATDYVSSLSPTVRARSETLMDAIRAQAGALRATFARYGFENTLADVETYMAMVTKLINEQDNAMDFAAHYNLSERHWRGVQPSLMALLNGAIDQYAEVSRTVFVENRRSLWVIIVVICVASWALMWYAQRMIGRIAKPVQYLTSRSLRIAGGRYEPVEMEQVLSCTEMEVLARAFNMMVSKIGEQVQKLHARIKTDERIHALEMENASMQIALSETERRLLQSLINPHFLFNCLSTISSMAYLEDAEKTVAVAGEISGYLHESLQSVGQEVPLCEEIDFLMRYISIQKIRFGDRISVQVDCAKKSAKRVVPKMLLQPLVENAISHGLGSRVAGGTIWVRAFEEGNATVIIIEDDGVGMPEEQVQALNEYLRGNPAPGKKGESGIGLTSAVRQLKRQFGQEAALTIAQRAGGGIQVSLRCPEGA